MIFLLIKIAELGTTNINNALVIDNEFIGVCNENGIIQVYSIEYNEIEKKCVFKQEDNFDIFENPHGVEIDNTNEQKNDTKSLYSDIVKIFN